MNQVNIQYKMDKKITNAWAGFESWNCLVVLYVALESTKSISYFIVLIVPLFRLPDLVSSIEISSPSLYS